MSSTASRELMLERARGALWGLAIGDAMGMPTQLMSRREVLATYGEIDRLEAPPDDHAIAAGLPAGSVTDDTDQALLLASLLRDGGHLDQQEWADALLAWEDRRRAAGSHDLLGPSTQAALAAIRSAGGMAEVSERPAALGTTNGAAMRIPPVGVAVDCADLDRLVDRVVEASRLTHRSSVALSGAAAVAAVVSSGVGGGHLGDARDVAVAAAERAAVRGTWVAGANVGRRIEWAIGLARQAKPALLPELIEELVGTSLSTQESVPAAFAILAVHGDVPWRAVCVAASVGGDSDTIAAMVGAMAGAHAGVSAFPSDVVRRVAEVNPLDIDPLAARLVELRES